MNRERLPVVGAVSLNVHDALLVTRNLTDVKVIEDLVRVSAPERVR